MTGPERVTRDQPGAVVAKELGINPRTLQAKAREGLVPHDLQPPGYRNFLYNTDEVRRTFPVATVRRRAQKIARERQAAAARERQAAAARPGNRYTVTRVYVVTCTDCEATATIADSREVGRYKETHDSTYHKEQEEGGA